MKKSLIIIFLFAFGVSFAQEKEGNLSIRKGTWNLGGELSFGKSNYENKGATSYETNNLNFSFSPKAGYAISDNFIIGLGLGYSYQNFEGSEDSFIKNMKSNSLSVFPYVRKHYNMSSKFSLYLQGEIKYSKSWFKQDDKNYNTSTDNNLFIGIRPGINYFLNKNFALEASIGSLGYSKSKIIGYTSEELKRESFSLSLNSSNMFFGLSYYF